MSRRVYVPDEQLPPITKSGTGRPKHDPATGRLRRDKKKLPSENLTLGQRALRDDENRRKLIAKGITPGNPGNSGGKKGRSGRRPDLWLRWCQKLMLNRGTQRAIREVIRNKAHPAYGTITKMIRDSAFPVQKQLDVTMRTSLEDILAQSYPSSTEK